MCLDKDSDSEKVILADETCSRPMRATICESFTVNDVGGGGVRKSVAELWRKSPSAR